MCSSSSGASPPTPREFHALARVPGVAAFAVLHAFGISRSSPRRILADIAAATDTKFAGAVDGPGWWPVGGRIRRRWMRSRSVRVSRRSCIWAWVVISMRCRTRWRRLKPRSPTTPATPILSRSAGPRLRLRIVGIVRRPLDLGNRGASGGVLVETPAFNRYYANRIGGYGSVFRVRTRQGQPMSDRVVASARRVFASAPVFQREPGSC